MILSRYRAETCLKNNDGQGFCRSYMLSTRWKAKRYLYAEMSFWAKCGADIDIDIKKDTMMAKAHSKRGGTTVTVIITKM